MSERYFKKAFNVPFKLMIFHLSSNECDALYKNYGIVREMCVVSTRQPWVQAQLPVW